MRQPGEPSVEEILESIKRVIAREDRSERSARRPAAPAPFERPAEPDDHAPARDDDVLDLAQHAAMPEPPCDPDAAPPLVTEGASSSMRGSLAALAAATAPPPDPSTRPGGETGVLEPLVRELLRPALADWLDRNLPAIVERMVAAEIARIAGRQG